MEKPILFSTPMIQAILAGRKTVTRRPVKVDRASKAASQECYSADGYDVVDTVNRTTVRKPWSIDCIQHYFDCPYGKIGDTLWVRETFAPFGNAFAYKADQLNIDPPMKWKPSIFMPRAASRINLLIKDIRVERLQDISEADAEAEGVEPGFFVGAHHADHRLDYRKGFKQLWNKINGAKYPWKDNVFVWVISFEVMK